MTDADIDFRQPPPPKGGPGSNKYARLAEALRERPGEWALVAGTNNHNLAARIRKGELPAFRPEGAFEAVSRSVAEGRADIYARFIGESGEHA